MDFLVPKLSATMETAKILRWLKHVGDKVALGEPLVELETDKAAMEVESPVAGTIDAVLAAEGEELAVGVVLARLNTGSEIASGGVTKQVHSDLPSKPVAAEAAQSAPAASAPRILASPFAKHLAKTNGLDLADLAAQNPLQRIRGRDVIAALKARDATARLGFEPLSAMRRQIADAVALSRMTIPSFVIDRWVDISALEKARATLAPEIETAIGIKPTFTDFLLHALVNALVNHPNILDRWHEEGGHPGRVRPTTIDIGLVVALSDGIMVPALRDLEGQSIREIVHARHSAVQRAHTGRLLQADYAPLSFSLSNIGKIGADRFEAIINPGQSGILAVGRQHERAVARAGQVVIARGVNLALSLDHRLIDGRAGAHFMETLAERIENPPSSN